MKTLLLALALARPAASQTRAAPVLETPALPIAAAPDVHPLLLGTLDDPGSPVSLELGRQAESLSALAAAGTLTPETAERALSSWQAEGGTKQAAAQVLRASLSDARVASRVAEAGHTALPSLGRIRAALGPASSEAVGSAAAAPSEDRLQSLFDKEAQKALGLEGVTVKGEKLVSGGQKTKKLGQGEFGIVFPHPAVDGAVAKMVYHSFEVAVFTSVTPQQTAAEEEATSKALAAAGAGPRHFGTRKVPLEPVAKKRYALVSARERIYGETLQELTWRRRFGPEEHRLVLEMLDRMADARIQVDDMRPANIMIGTTKLDPVRRAYVVDGGKIQEVDPALSRDEVRSGLQHQSILIMGRMDPRNGVWIEKRRSMDQLLNEALERSAETTWWQRFWGALKEAFANAYIPAK